MRASSVLRRIAVVPVVVMVSACDPIAGVTLHQRFGPMPANCIDSALAGAPGVRRARRTEYSWSRGYRFEIDQPDSIAARGAIPLFADLERLRGDTIELQLNVMYFHGATFAITPEMVRRSVASAKPIAEHVRAVCGGNAPAAITCRVEGFGRSRSCDPIT